MEATAAQVFIVDDDDAVRASLRTLLESYGMRVQDFDSTREFLRHYRPMKGQCLLLDQHLKGATGLDFLASPDGAELDLPVILVTGEGDAAIHDRARALGAIGYFEKPPKADLLVAAIAEAVGTA
jgi:two-component system, LuxR family, response regulator FixJ